MKFLWLFAALAAGLLLLAACSGEDSPPEPELTTDEVVALWSGWACPGAASFVTLWFESINAEFDPTGDATLSFLETFRRRRGEEIPPDPVWIVRARPDGGSFEMRESSRIFTPIGEPTEYFVALQVNERC